MICHLRVNRLKRLRHLLLRLIPTLRISGHVPTQNRLSHILVRHPSEGVPPKHQREQNRTHTPQITHPIDRPLPTDHLRTQKLHHIVNRPLRLHSVKKRVEPKISYLDLYAVLSFRYENILELQLVMIDLLRLAVQQR